MYSPKDVKECYVRFLWTAIGVMKEIGMIDSNTLKHQVILDRIMGSRSRRELMEISDGVSLEDVKVSLFDADGIMFAEFAYGTAYDLESGQFELKLDGNILTASYTRF